MDETLNCLICASVSLPKPVVVINGEGERVNIKTEVIEEENEEVKFGKGKEPPFYGEFLSVQKNLKTFFILRKVLKIPEETLCELLKQDDLYRFEKLVNVCELCGELVQSFYETLKEICKLQRKLVRIENEVKGKIRESKFCNGGNQVWKQIREEALKNDGFEDPFDPEISEEIHVDMDAQEYKSEPIEIPSEVESFSFEEEIDEEYNFVSEPLNFDRNEIETDDDDDSISLSSSSSRWSPSSSASSSCSSSPPRIPSKLLPYPSSSSTRVKKNFQNLKAKIIPKPLNKSISSPNPSSPSILANRDSENWKKNKGKLPNYESDSKLEFNSVLIGTQRFYQCYKCPTETCQLEKILEHVKLHKNGRNRNAICCEECGCYMLPEDYEAHKNLRHRSVFKRISQVKQRERDFYFSHSSQ